MFPMSSCGIALIPVVWLLARTSWMTKKSTTKSSILATVLARASHILLLHEVVLEHGAVREV